MCMLMFLYRYHGLAEVFKSFWNEWSEVLYNVFCIYFKLIENVLSFS